MTKNITIGVLSVFCLALIVFSMVMRTDAKTFELLATTNMTLAFENSKQAHQFELLARANELEAHRQRQLAEKALQECQKKNKH